MPSAKGGWIVSYVSPDGGDGARVYDISGFDEPPPRFPRLAVRLPSVPVTAWPFLIVAIAVAVLRVQDLWTWGWASIGTVYVAAEVLGTLMPVALLIGCPRVWRSAPVVLIGVIAWVWITPALGLAYQVQYAIVHASSPTEFIPYALGVAQDLAGIPALAGPALIAYGLSRRRRTETTWPRAMVLAAIVIAAAWGLSDARSTIDIYWSQSFDMTGSPSGLTNREIVFAITSGLRSVYLLGFGALAWSSLSAVRAGEPRQSFWMLMFAGSVMLFVLGIYSDGVMRVAYPGSVVGDIVIAIYQALNDYVVWAYVAAYGALVIAFGLGLPPDPLDLGDVVGAEDAGWAPGSLPPIG
jgi:hypothetical protein